MRAMLLLPWLLFAAALPSQGLRLPKLVPQVPGIDHGSRTPLLPPPGGPKPLGYS
jgi:hypothetical protein